MFTAIYIGHRYKTGTKTKTKHQQKQEKAQRKKILSAKNNRANSYTFAITFRAPKVQDSRGMPL